MAVMDLSFLKYPLFFRKKDLWQLTRWTEYSVKQAIKVIAISRQTKRDIQERYGKSGDAIEVVYPAVDRKLFSPVSEEAVKRVRIKYSLRKNYFVHVGTLQPRKNLVRLIEAFKVLVEKSSEVQLVLVGKVGWMADDILAAIKRFPTPDNIRLLGYVPLGDLPALYGGAVGVVMAGIYEGFGIPALEAMACGTVPLVAKTASLPEVVGAAGLLFEPLDSQAISKTLLKALQLSLEERKKFNQLAQEQLQQFNWQKSATKILEVVNGVAI